jgi:hypothetical protein
MSRVPAAPKLSCNGSILSWCAFPKRALGRNPSQQVTACRMDPASRSSSGDQSTWMISRVTGHFHLSDLRCLSGIETGFGLLIFPSVVVTRV